MRRNLPQHDGLTAALAKVGGRPLIVFDGVCVLCTASAVFILRHDRARHFRLTTAQGLIGQVLYRELGLSSDEDGTMILIENGLVWTHSDAAMAIATRLGWPWRLAALARFLPSGLRDALYRVVARHRYRWFGKRDQCWIPSPAEADRLL